MSGMGCSLDVLLQKGVDALATISAIADLDKVAMVPKMNAGTLSGTVAVDVEDYGITCGNALGRFLTHSANESGPQR